MYAAHLSHVITEDISDHLPCLLSLPYLSASQKDPVMIKKRRLNKKAIASIKHDLQSIIYSDIVDVNEAFNELHESVLGAINKNVPERTLRKKSVQHDEPWIMPGICNSLRKQRKLYKEINSPGVATCKHVAYKSYKKELQQIIRKSKELFYSQQCIDFKNNTRKLWNIINSVVKKTSNKQCVINQLKVGSVVFTSGIDIANELGKYFSGIGKELAMNLSGSKISIDDYIDKIPIESGSLFLYLTNNIEVMKITQNLANKRSSGYDGISNILLKDILPIILDRLVAIFNRSLQDGNFPDHMKHADVIPLHKSKCKQERNNYRPILLLLTMSKLLEKIIYKRTYQFLENTNQLYVSQYDFRSKHSCEHMVSELLSEIIMGHEWKRKTV